MRYWKYFFIVILALQESQCRFLSWNWNIFSDIGKTKREIIRPRLEGSMQYSGSIFQFLTLLYDTAQSSAQGTGVVWNAHWMVTTSFAVAGYESSFSNLFVYTSVTDLNNLNDGIAVRRKIKNIITYDAATITGSLHALALVKVCPRFLQSQFVTLLSSSPSAMTLAQLITYDSTNVVTGMKFIGSASECSSIANWDENYDVCLSNDASTYATAADLPGIVVSDNGDIVGFITAIQSDPDGEIVIDLTKYETWINTKTNT